MVRALSLDLNLDLDLNPNLNLNLNLNLNVPPNLLPETSRRRIIRTAPRTFPAGQNNGSNS